MGSSASEPGETQVSVPRAIQEQEAVVAGSESLKGRGRTSPVDRKQTRRKDPWHRPCIPFRLPDKEVSMGEGYRTSRAIETRSPACCLQTGLPLLDHCSPACQQGRKPGLGGGRFPSDETTRPALLREGTRRRRSAHSQPAPLPSLIAAALCFSGHLLSEESPGGRRFLPRAGCSLAGSSWPQPGGGQPAGGWVGGGRQLLV